MTPCLLRVVTSGYRAEEARPVENPVTERHVLGRILDSECLVREGFLRARSATWPTSYQYEGDRDLKIRLGVDVACRAAHQASCADERGEMVFVGHRFRTDPDELDKLWARLPQGAEVMVVMEPTRNAWVVLAAWFRRRGACPYP